MNINSVGNRTFTSLSPLANFTVSQFVKLCLPNPSIVHYVYWVGQPSVKLTVPAKSESKTFKNFREQGGFHTTNALYIKRTPKIKRKQSFLSTMQN